MLQAEFLTDVTRVTKISLVDVEQFVSTGGYQIMHRSVQMQVAEKNVANMVQSGVEFEELDASAFDEGECLIPACGTPRMAFLRVNGNKQYF